MPTTETTTAGRGAPVDIGGTWDDALGVHAIFVAIPRVESVYFRVVVESWEGHAVERTLKRHWEEDPSRLVVVVMAVRDFAESCARGLSRVLDEVGGRQITPPPALVEALRRDLLGSTD